MNTQIRTLIVDDEPLARKRIRRFLAGEPGIEIVGECGSGREAIEQISALNPDLVFLDIHMPEVDGFKVIRHIPRQKMPLVIFITAHDQHAIEAFEVHALDYLLKPFSQERFKITLARARERLADTGASTASLAAFAKQFSSGKNYLDRFIVKASSRVFFVKAADVDYLESAGNYVLLHVENKTHIVRETMSALEAGLDPKHFQRISRSLIVNVERIKELQPMGKGEYVVLLTNGKQLSMSRGIRELFNALSPK